jgi:SAM-dependent methyltransferase
MSRLAAERDFHDAQARQRRGALRPQDWVFGDDDYLGHETWIRPAFERLGDVRGARVLDLGSGHGMAAVVLARRGARVTGLDLSVGYLAEARDRATANHVDVDWVQADAEHLPFPDASFDRVWGNAVLHHLDIGRAAAELYRVLRPGGWAVLCEPWGDNPLFRWARCRLPYPGKARTADETPLGSDCLPVLRRWFPDLRIEGRQLFSSLHKLWGGRPRAGGLERLDRGFLRLIPSLEAWCRYMILRLPRPATSAETGPRHRPCAAAAAPAHSQ